MPQERGLFIGLNNALRGKESSFSLRRGIFLGRGKPLKMVRNDICSYSTSNEKKEQNNIHINQYVTSNNNNLARAQGDVYDKIPDHSDSEKERKGEKGL